MLLKLSLVNRDKVNNNIVTRNGKKLSALSVLTEVAIQKVFLEKGVLKICNNRNINMMQQIYRRKPMPKLLCNFTEITLLHGCSPVSLLHIFS